MTRQGRRGLKYTVAMTVLVDMLGLGLITPVLPFYAENLGATATVVALLGTAYAAVQFAFMPVMGQMADRLGRRPVMLLSISLNIVGYLLFAVSSSLPLLFVSRMISGFGAANAAVATTVLIDITPKEERVGAMGLIGGISGLGMVVGPGLGGLLGQWGATMPALGAAVLAGLNFLAVLIFIPETGRAASEAPEGEEPQDGFFRSLRLLVGRPRVGALLLMFFVVSTGFAFTAQVFPLFIGHVATERAHAEPETHTEDTLKEAVALSSYVLVTMALLSSIMQLRFAGWLARRFSPSRLAIVGIVIDAIALGSIPLAEPNLLGIPWLFGAAVLLALGNGLVSPALMGVLVSAVEPEQQGTINGLITSVASLGGIIGPVASGPLYEVFPGLPFFVGSAIVLSSLLGAGRLDADEAPLPTENGSATRAPHMS